MIGVSLIGLLCSCESLIDIETKPIENDTYYKEEGMQPNEVDSLVVPEDHPAIACMVKKAHQIADIKWMPLRSVPSLSENWTPAGTQMQGIPYSSVKEKDKFIGQEVSFYTFMSAVQNPRSVMYTEDVKRPPYNGENCGMYYGTVCSMAVNYALGIERPIESKMYESLPYIARVKKQHLERLYVGDILWSKGHVVLIIGIERDEEGRPKSFSILESSGNTRIKTLSRDAFQTRWEKDGWVAYRYLKLADNVNYKPLPFVLLPGDVDSPNYDYNNFISLSRGDYSCYRKGEDVVINVFDNTYSDIVISRNGLLERKISIVNGLEDYSLVGLRGGKYSAFLSNGNDITPAIHFEVIEESTSVRRFSDGYMVSFASSDSFPEYIVICTLNGNRDAIIDITDADRDNGYKMIKGSYTGRYWKVFYKGEYGRVSNMPIQL